MSPGLISGGGGEEEWLAVIILHITHLALVPNSFSAHLCSLTMNASKKMCNILLKTQCNDHYVANFLARKIKFLNPPVL